MPYDSNGNFTRVHNWEEDRQNDIDIVSDRHDEEDDNFADGLSQCLVRDGRAPMAGDLKMGSYQIKNLAAGSALTDAVNRGQLDEKATPEQVNTAISTAISTMLSTMWPVDSIYIGTQNVCPLASLISGSTWTKIATSIITGVNSNVPVKGTGTSMGITGGGLTDGSGAGSGSWVSGTGGSGDKRIAIVKDSYNLALDNTSHSTNEISGGRAIGLVTNANNSGIVGTVTSSSLAVNIWKRTA